MGGRLRSLRPRIFSRKAGAEPGNPILCIMCEDSQSSINYLEGLRAWAGLPDQAAVVRHSPKGTNPKNVVESLKEEKKTHRLANSLDLAFDEFWAVFDVDTHDHLTDALQQARDNGFHVVVSSPCFEEWLLLHLGVGFAPLPKGDDAQSALKAALPGGEYEKGRERYEFFLDHGRLVQALEWNKRLEDREPYDWRSGTVPPNPYTNFHHLALRLLTHPSARPPDGPWKDYFAALGSRWECSTR